MMAIGFICVWERVVPSLATLGIVLAEMGLMLGIVKPAETLRHVGAILGFTIILLLFPHVLMNVWLGMSPWQRTGLTALGIGILLWRRPRR